VGEVVTIGLDLAKTVFQAHGADASGEVVFRKRTTERLSGSAVRRPNRHRSRLAIVTNAVR
jgi:hypothetical protein